MEDGSYKPLEPPVMIASLPSKGRIAAGLEMLVDKDRVYSGLDMVVQLKEGKAWSIDVE